MLFVQSVVHCDIKMLLQLSYSYLITYDVYWLIEG